MNLLWQMDSPPRYQRRDDLHTTTPNLADEPTLANGLPRYQSRDDLHTTTPNWADEPTLANGLPTSTTAGMTCILLHKTWQMNLLCPMDPPPVPEQRCLAYHCIKLGRWTYFGHWTPHQYQSRDDLHTTTPNLADEPTLSNGPPTSTRAEMPCIPLHKTWQMNLHWLMTPHQYQSRYDLHSTTQILAD